MFISVDWLSFTLPFETLTGSGGEILLWESLLQSIDRYCGAEIDFIAQATDFVHGKGRAPYTDTWHSDMIGITLFARAGSPHMLIELSGKGCQAAREAGVLEAWISRHSGTATRVDIAVDFPTATRPAAFAERRDNQRFKSGGHMHSERGETVYVGSRTSDRYARVYRYEPPHPRSDLLRVEMVFRKDQAKAVCRMLAYDGLRDTTAVCGSVFGWQHPLWPDDFKDAAPLPVERTETHQGKTVHWLFKQVLPACEKVVRSGERDHIESFVNHLLEMLENTR